MPAKRRDDLAEGAAGESGDIADAAFDAWLRRGLHALFGQPDDALPDALLRIIEEDEARRAAEQRAPADAPARRRARG